MASDELRIVLENVQEKFDLVIERINMMNERMDRHEKAEEERFERIENAILETRKDLNDHRSSTELHYVKKKKRA